MAAREVGHAVEDTHLGQKAGNVARRPRPDVGFVLAADDARDLQTPEMRRPGLPPRIAEALEGNRHLGDEPVADELGRGLEEHVPRRVAARHAEAAAPDGARPQDRVPLHAITVHREHIRPLLVEERVEIDQEQVVLDRLVAVSPVRADHARVGVVRMQPDVEVGAVVGEVDVARFAGGDAVERPALDELGDVGGVAPDRVVEPAVDHRRLRQSRETDGRAAGQRTAIDPRARAWLCLRRSLGMHRLRGARAGETDHERGTNAARQPPARWTLCRGRHQAHSHPRWLLRPPSAAVCLPHARDTYVDHLPQLDRA